MIIDADGKKHLFEGDSNLSIPKSKSIKFSLPPDDIQCWYDYSYRSFLCERSDLILFEYLFNNLGEGGRVFILHIESRSISFTHEKGLSGWLGGPESHGDGKKYWEISNIGLPIRHKDRFQARKYYPLTNSHCFASREQQELALDFLTLSLSRYSNALDAAHGRAHRNEVIFSKKLQNKLSSGELINE